MRVVRFNDGQTQCPILATRSAITSSPYPAHSEEAQQALRYCERHYDTRTFVPPVVRLLVAASLVQCIPTDRSDGAGRLAAFDAIPGQVFKAEVIVLTDAVAQGQLQPTGALLDPEEPVSQGRALALIEVTDDLSTYQPPGGAAAQVAVYTEHWHHFAIIRRILLRMKSWDNYIIL